MQPLEFMALRKARLAISGEEQPETPSQYARPALLLAPVPKQGMRYALKGERPPSKYAPGQSDGVIARYDAYAAAFKAGQVRQHGR